MLHFFIQSLLVIQKVFNFHFKQYFFNLIYQEMFGGGFRGFGDFGGFGGASGDDEDMPSQKKEEVDTNKYYELLGVDKKATTQQIRKAFRRKALKEHPDKGGDPQKFKEITGAYEVLSNPEKRQLYDDYGEQGVKNGGAPGGGGFGGLFDLFNGGGKKSSGPRKGKAKLIELQVTLEQIFNGAMKNVKITRDRTCEPCEGKGGSNVAKCTKCKGQGVVTKLVQLGPGMYTQSQGRCNDCQGLGQTMKEQDRCKSCKGKKVVKADRVLEVAIETGCPNQHDYIFTGQNDQYPGIIPGDVYVRIKIKKHELFQRRGADLVIIKKIALLEALTGVTMEIKHLDGQKHIIATAPGEILNHQELKTVKGLGLPYYKDPMSHGHLYIEFLITYPKKGSISAANIEKIAKILNGKTIKTDGYSKTNKNKILEDFRDSDTNTSPTGGDQREYEEQMGGRSGAQQVRCQQQ